MVDKRKAVAAGTIIGGVTLAALVVLRKRKRAYSLVGRSIIVTGASRGLGLEIVRAFGLGGAGVTILARDEEELSEARNRLAEEGVEVETGVCDVTDEDDVKRAVVSVINKRGSVDILINNAGEIVVGPMSEMTREDFEGALSTHLWGPMNMIDAVLPGMRARGEGRIVNIASIGGKIPVPHLLPYSTSKFALVGYSEGLRTELANNGIVVTTVCPGLMRTGSTEFAKFKGQHRKEYGWFATADNMPGLSMDDRAAAEAIVRACIRGNAELILTAPAKLAARAYGIAPSLALGAESLVNRILPRPGGIGKLAKPGSESHPELTPTH